MDSFTSVIVNNNDDESLDKDLAKDIKKIKYTSDEMKGWLKTYRISLTLSKESVLSLAAYKVESYTGFGKTTPLFWAIKFHPESVQKLIVNGHDGYFEMVETVTGMSALMWAVLQNNISVVNILLDNNVNLHAKNKYGVTALDLAVTENDLDMVYILLKHGEATGCPYIEFPLILAVENMSSCDIMNLYNSEELNDEIIRKSLKNDENLIFIINLVKQSFCEKSSQNKCLAKTEKSSASLTVALDKFDLIKMLLKLYIDEEPKSESGIHLLKIAIANNVYEAIPILVELGADINGPNFLHLAANMCDTRLGRLLLEEGADVEAKDQYGQTPLDIAITKPNFDCEFLKLFIDYNADIKSIFKNKISPFDLLALKQDVAFMKMLFKNGVCYDEVGNKFSSSVFNEFETSRESSVLSKKAPLKLNTDGKLLMSAQKMFFKGIAKNKPDLVEMAIEDGAEPRSCSVSMPFPLHFAVSKNYGNIVLLLLTLGLDPNLRDYNGDSPVKIAFQSANKSLWLLLLSFGGCYATGVSVEGLEKSLNQVRKLLSQLKQIKKLQHKHVTNKKEKAVITRNKTNHTNIVSKHEMYCHLKQIDCLFESVKNGNYEQTLKLFYDFVKCGSTENNFIKETYGNDVIHSFYKNILLNTVDRKGRTLLAVAVEKGRQKIVEKLLEIRIDMWEELYWHPQELCAIRLGLV